RKSRIYDEPTYISNSFLRPQYLMVKPVKQSLGFLATTALGGVIFLLPVIVIGALLGKVGQVVLAVATSLNHALPIESARGWSLLVLIAIALVLMACFVAGLVARWT